MGSSIEGLVPPTRGGQAEKKHLFFLQANVRKTTMSLSPLRSAPASSVLLVLSAYLEEEGAVVLQFDNLY